jgi:hypothetical protein
MMPDVVTVAVTRQDGGMTVVRVITTEYHGDGAVAWTVDPTPDYIASIIAKYEWAGDLAPVSWRIVPNDIVDDSTDRSYRNAWKDDGGRKPGHDMVKARDIHRHKLRRLRAPLLEDLDLEYTRADERNDRRAKDDIVLRKQALRDITADPRIDAAQTIDALKAITLGRD